MEKAECEAGERAVKRLVQNLRMGALGETQFCECAIEAAERWEPELVWRSLPADLRPRLRHWMLDEACQACYPRDLVNTEPFAALCAFLRTQPD